MAAKIASAEKVRTFLDRAWPTMLGVVGTSGADGFPHVVPVWYRYDGERVHVWTEERRTWVKNIARDSRVGFSVQEDGPPYAAVVMRGRATILTSSGDEVLQEIQRITRRYIAEPEVEDYIGRWPQLRTIVTITPDRISAWGEGY